jgi:hypothetical protein
VAAPDTVLAVLKEVEFIVKDAKAIPGWPWMGYAAFNDEPTSGTSAPVTAVDRPPQQNDAR